MGNVLKIVLKAIISPEAVLKGTLGNKKEKIESLEINTKDKFIVNPDGSISLNPNNEVVKKAFNDNVEKLQSIRKG
ncbi:hypothetical protein KKI73_001430 [Providencia rettgeri]|nr:hypothetical protein [Providencia rettgeri]